ncbi:LacI family DNA-binding transcriptional regulator [Pectinatus haikarae]|uniref:LacI family transcriptional regulator/LacI family asc operon transcriptional repressor n=1 Tax=Pectinatus haikarae TaxID=349096 RepID=A0ABT9YCC5_9FIRM|nr:LacI family DNA-binding transcriptional regulator [Pectinatus haikarae]MDQ0204734.1 LacI family transcriptional regulator/LacI family asc operon transcriptional repressor [Pectinatus haikarae]
MTIYDIAEKCGVSIATVSRVLNGSSRVSAKTKEKILLVMKEQNYQPNPFARGLGLNSMKMIGVLCEDVSDSFYATAISLIESYLRLIDWNVILGCTGRGSGLKYKHLQFLMEKHVDAIIIIGTPFNHTKDLDYLKNVAKKRPVIMVNSYIKHNNIYGIICDEETGMSDIVGKLAEKGCKSVLYLYDSLTYSGRQKLTGYKKGIATHKLDENPLLQNKINRSLEDVEQTVKKLIEQNVYFDAVVTSEDLLAIGAQRAILQMGKNMPIVGCNNSLLAQCATPMITSLDNQLEILCREAVELLTKLMNDKEVPSKMIFPAKLYQRESFIYA